MCGRTACTLGPDEFCKACSVMTVAKDGTKKYETPKWREHPGDHKYRPSANLPPSSYTPVMISEQHVRGVKRGSEGDALPAQRVIQPMMWGLVPHFYKGDGAAGYRFNTSNCRLEEIEEKKAYKPSLDKGQRCVVLCDGFYEWQSAEGITNKQPFFVHAPQPEGVKIWDRSSWDVEGVWTEEEGWKGPKVLKMAGIFSVWISATGEKVMSYSVMTKAAEGKFASVHSRIPAILNTDQEVEDWLDFGRVDTKEALGQLAKGQPELEWYPVSKQVNNSRNQEPDLNHPIDLDNDQKPPEVGASSKFLFNWLLTGSGKAKKEEKSDVKQEKDIKEEKNKEEKGNGDEQKEKNGDEQKGDEQEDGDEQVKGGGDEQEEDGDEQVKGSGDEQDDDGDEQVKGGGDEQEEECDKKEIKSEVDGSDK